MGSNLTFWWQEAASASSLLLLVQTLNIDLETLICLLDLQELLELPDGEKPQTSRSESLSVTDRSVSPSVGPPPWAGQKGRLLSEHIRWCCSLKTEVCCE